MIEPLFFFSFPPYLFGCIFIGRKCYVLFIYEDVFLNTVFFTAVYLPSCSKILDKITIISL